MEVDALPMVAPPEVYRRRRARLAEALKRPLVILAGQARSRNYAGNTYPFRAGSTYLYFGGPPIEGAVWLIEPGSDGNEGCALLRPTSTFDDAVWTGEPPGDDAVAVAAGISTSAIGPPCSIGSLLGGRRAAAILPPCPVSMEWARSLELELAEPEELLAIIDMRLVKDEYELAAMRRAATVSVEAHRSAMSATKVGRAEADVAAAFVAVLMQHQCEPSFTPGVTVRGEILHSSGYSNPLQADRLMLLDAGAEEPGGYASDVTRTYPVNGEFSSIQRQIYDTVLRAETSAIDACVPGGRFRDVHDLAATVICEGLVDAGLLRGDPADLAGRGAHTLFFTHGLGHLIGLDVHDMEDFGDLAGYAPGRTRRPEFGNKFLRLDRDLAPGMTVTIEPGIYIVPAIWRNEDLWGPFADVVDRTAVDELLDLSFGGIRIEDTICVRGGDAPGPEILTDALPKEADAVAAIVRGV